MLVHLYRLIVLISCGYLNYRCGISPNQKDEMGFHASDKPYQGGEMKTPLVRNMISLGLLPFILYNASTYHYSLTTTEVFLVGVLLMMYGLRIWCFKELDSLFTFGLGIRAHHKLITTGPYKYLIHPSYTAQLGCAYIYWILLLLGHNSLLFTLLFIALVTYSLYVVRYRSQLEEAMMLEHFKEDYTHYIASRYRFIPGIY